MADYIVLMHAKQDMPELEIKKDDDFETQVDAENDAQATIVANYEYASKAYALEAIPLGEFKFRDLSSEEETELYEAIAKSPHIAKLMKKLGLN